MYTAPVQLVKGWKDLPGWAPEQRSLLHLHSFAEPGDLVRKSYNEGYFYIENQMHCVGGNIGCIFKFPFAYP